MKIKLEVRLYQKTYAPVSLALSFGILVFALTESKASAADRVLASDYVGTSALMLVADSATATTTLTLSPSGSHGLDSAVGDVTRDNKNG